MFKFSPVTVKLDNVGAYKSDGAQRMEDLLNRTQNPYELEDYISRNGENGVLKWTEGGDNFQVSVITEGNKKRIEVLDLSTAALTDSQINEIKTYAMPHDFVTESMVPVISDITRANDYQNLAFMNAKGVFDFTDCMTISPVGKSIEDLLVHVCATNPKNSFNTKTFLGKMVQAGLGELVVVEIIQNSETGFDAVVLQDPEGNYSIYYQSTKNEIEDIMHDGITYFSEKLPFGSTGTVQNDQANDLALKYAIKAKQTGKKINISGYSLGGSLAESAIWKLKQEGYGYKIANVTLINPLHADLPEKAIEYMYDLNEDGRLSIYANKQDIVHKHNLEDELTPITKYIDLEVSSAMRQKMKEDYKASVIQDLYNQYIEQEVPGFVNSIANKVVPKFDAFYNWIGIDVIGLVSRHSDDAITTDPALVSEYFDQNGNFIINGKSNRISILYTPGDTNIPDNVC